MWLSQPLSRHYYQPALKGDSSRARPVGDAARGESGGIGSIASSSEARRPYSNQRCGCECNEQTEGLQRGFCCLRQPLSQTFGLPAPRPGRLLGAVQAPTQKLSPLAGKVARSAERGTAQRCQAVLLFPLSFAYAQQLPHKWWRLLVQYKLSVQCRTPSRSDRFNGVTGGAGGPKGRNRNLPWPPAKRL